MAMLFPFLFILLVSHTDSKTLESDIHALESIGQLIDPNTALTSTFFRTWNFALDPCDSPGRNFLGILCKDNKSISRVMEINLEGDGLEGFLSPSLGDLAELTSLNLRNNMFRGPIPDSFANMSKITSLVLANNFLSGRIPDGLKQLKRLQVLDLSHNMLSNSVPAAISNLRTLTHLNLSNNELAGRIPDLTGLWKLVRLDFSYNQLSGDLPELPCNLRSLMLGHNLITGNISAVDLLVHVVEVDLRHNRLRGEVNPVMLTLPEVRRVDISSNMFTKLEVRKMAKGGSKLEAIEGQKNEFSGHLPVNLVSYERLRSVNLGHNKFSGEIPKQYGERVMKGQWKRVFLNDNLLVGTAPKGLIGGPAKGSISRNCLSCHGRIEWCGGEQRPPAECL